MSIHEPAPLTDEQPSVAPQFPTHDGKPQQSPGRLLFVYLLVGIFFGVILIKSEVACWFRIQEMFRFQSFHMYGIIGSAIAVSALSILLLKKLGWKSLSGDPIQIPPKEMKPGAVRYWLGGTIFGMGWALTGACPGPIYALIGSGVTVFIVAMASALLGTWVYALSRPNLPH